ncbi:outer membrane efflux protein [Sulfuricurvum kujiense DSM 16994]|uniref:Outer membrane efflux protein n=1 Tax=Sulfuricurvum kujiense (strain ATCC BAA-921 / DSM 16994 / JCM 11577 / YK-1) TaxID=709032 RepID=E4U2T8_SULKY|nr:TolC family protein [Sulfuricurvum kujiense]ADR34702.1 outer membrane efflux protein [Sulfuricurvum kujiense DSM 16994]
MVARTVSTSLAALFILSGCSAISQKEAFDSVNQLTAEQGVNNLQWIKTAQEAQSVDESVRALLSKPLTQEDALRIMLINNRALQQSYENIGIAQSELVEAGLMRNPLLGYSIGRSNGASTSTISVEIAFLDLLWIPLRRELGGLALEEAILTVGDSVLRSARDAKKSYIDARVSEEKVALFGPILKSHEASLQLAVRQYTAGNLSKRDMLRIQESYERARIESIKLSRENAAAREALNKTLGLYGEQTYYTLSTESLKRTEPAVTESGLEKRAIANRLDMRSAMKSVDYAAAQAGYSEKTRFVDELELSLESEKTTGEKRFNTFGIKLPIPIFDFGQARVSKAQAIYNQSVHQLYERAVNIRSEVREGYAHLRYTYDIAHSYDEVIVQTNQQILEETQLMYNGMLDGIYELLEDQRRAGEAKMEALDARGEVQKAQADLEYTIGGKL